MTSSCIAAQVLTSPHHTAQLRHDPSPTDVIVHSDPLYDVIVTQRPPVTSYQPRRTNPSNNTRQFILPTRTLRAPSMNDAQKMPEQTLHKRTDPIYELDLRSLFGARAAVPEPGDRTRILPTPTSGFSGKKMTASPLPPSLARSLARPHTGRSCHYLKCGVCWLLSSANHSQASPSRFYDKETATLKNPLPLVEKSVASLHRRRH